MNSKAAKVIEKCINDLETKALPHLNVKAALLVETAMMRLIEALEFEENSQNSGNSRKFED